MEDYSSVQLVEGSVLAVAKIRDVVSHVGIRVITMWLFECHFVPIESGETRRGSETKTFT